jgi:hypothetical protein
MFSVVFWDILPLLSSLMMEAVRTSETSVDNNFTRQYMPEDNTEHHTSHRENLKSHHGASLKFHSCMADALEDNTTFRDLKFSQWLIYQL